MFTGYLDNFCGTSRNGCLTNPQNRTKVIYGEELALKHLFIRDEYDWGNESRGFSNAYGYLEISRGAASADLSNGQTSIALVRGIGSASTQPTTSVSVSEPNQLIFFSVFLLIVLRFKSASE